VFASSGDRHPVVISDGGDNQATVGPFAGFSADPVQAQRHGPRCARKIRRVAHGVTAWTTKWRQPSVYPNRLPHQGRRRRSPGLVLACFGQLFGPRSPGLIPSSSGWEEALDRPSDRIGPGGFAVDAGGVERFPCFIHHREST